MLHTSPLSLTRQPNDGTFEIIWPEHVRFAINDREALNFRDDFTLMFGMKTQTIVKKRWYVLCMAARFWKGFRGIFVLCRTGKDGL